MASKKHSKPGRIRSRKNKGSGTGSATQDYSVGYCKPPEEHQFKPGHSGNPKGRKQKPKPDGIKSMIRQELLEPVTVSENGKKITLPAFQLGIRRLRNETLKGNMAAARQLNKLAIQFLFDEDSTIPLTTEQEDLLKRLIDDE